MCAGLASIRVRYLEAYGDSKLIVNQVKCESEVRHEDLVPYHHAIIKMANLFEDFFIGHVSRSQNTRADALAALATTLALPVDTKYHLTMATRHLVCSKHMLRTKEVYNISTDLELRDWQFFLIDYALHGLLPDDPKEAASIRRGSLRFYYDPTLKTLYRRSYDGILLRCLSNLEAQEVLKEAHDGICGVHQPVQNLRTDCTGLGIFGQP